MRTLLVALFPAESAAYHGASALQRLDRQGDIKLRGSVAVQRDAHGATTIVESDGGWAGTIVGIAVGEQRVLTELERAFREKEAARQRRRDARERAPHPSGVPAVPAEHSPSPARRRAHSSPQSSVADEIAKLKSLREAGALTDDQYDRAVERVLNED